MTMGGASIPPMGLCPPGPTRAKEGAQPGRGQQRLEETPRTAEGKASPWVLPDPSDMGTRCSRNRMTINGKNLLSRCCQAGSTSWGVRVAKKAPFFPLLMFSQVEGTPREVPPKVGNFAQATVPVLEPKPERYAKMEGSELAQGSLVF